MPSVLAIVSKAVFEKDAKGSKVGDVVPFERYVSKNKGISPVAGGGAIFLVTVRPPDEHLWLVGILESPTFDGENWNATRNTMPITDITPLKGTIRFENNSGISAKKGALGMSLQTPRILAESDVALLRGGAAGAGAGASAKGHLNAHEPHGPTPCLCHKCVGQAPEKVTIDGLDLVRERAEAKGRFVWFWMPAELAADRATVLRAVESRLHARASGGKKRAYEDLDTVFTGGGGDGDDE
ncbi:MAG: hypothetical protein U0270_03215 [Labilithrix sp.]